ncbi:hypothetical protein PF008_g25569 [Phytophthora fragariae]|nr:hypothetical protein PF003_g37230 [Phytophthora fragariae]KAE9290555.1 hypothetical protein PF008_g25569 [Phytophthora fragariae]
MEAVIKAAENMMIKAVENVLVSSLTDGPTAQSTMWRCMAASRQPKYPLMSLAPVMDEPDDQLNAEGHLTAIKRFLLFFISLSPDVCSWLATHCGITKRLANILGVPLISCASRRLNLVVRDYLKPHDSIL